MLKDLERPINPLYKSNSAKLEQMALDLASSKEDSLPENWELELLDNVFPSLKGQPNILM